MDRIDIRIIMLRKGISAIKIAKECNVTPSAIYKVMAGDTTSRRIASALERVLEMPIEEIQRAYQNRYAPAVETSTETVPIAASS